MYYRPRVKFCALEFVQIITTCIHTPSTTDEEVDEMADWVAIGILFSPLETASSAIEQLKSTLDEVALKRDILKLSPYSCQFAFAAGIDSP